MKTRHGLHGFTLIVLLTAALALPALAQTSTNTPAAPPDMQSIGSQAFTWLSSFDTNSTTFRNNRGSFWTSVISEQNGVAPLLNEIGMGYDVFQPGRFNATNGTSTSVFVEGRERNTGVAGTISSLQGGIGFGLMVWDVRFELAVDFGDNLKRAAKQDVLYGEVDFTVLKAIGAHASTGLGMFVDFPTEVPGLFAQIRADF